MILWTIKLISSVRKAIAGRKHPSQLAWGVAFGALVGLIPHGNLLAVVLVLLVLTLRVNHAMVALVGIGVTLVAPRLDPTFDSFGRWFFERPGVAEKLAIAWQYPLMPWTDLNNTVVMGSFLIGLIALVPLYLLTNPLFKAWAPADEIAEGDMPTKRSEKRKSSGPKTKTNKQALHRIDSNHDIAGQPHVAVSPIPSDDELPVQPSEDGSPAVATSGRVYDVRRIDPSVTKEPAIVPADSQPANSAPIAPPPLTPAPHPARPTRVAITAEVTPPKPKSTRAALVSKSGPIENNPKNTVDAYESSADDQHKIDEALSYLLRQLRDSQDKDAA